ncbi:hypothetical protein [uncultured Methylobacterium sp.]|jgi:hypothetical protein|uniref:hypothetical protein n=1 Tax=uncultured Methylobacterium sp. TaxID=157278 RepID=UPI002619F3D4|nr:hypothetical protein [uncultured Methylobacterium sp.]
MLKHFDAVPSATRKNAVMIIEAQEDVPVSPLKYTQDGTLQLCAAAALVVAGAKSEEEKQFIISRLEANGPSAIEEMFEEKGWGRQLGRRVLMENDSLQPSERKEGVVRLLSGRLES